MKKRKYFLLLLFSLIVVLVKSQTVDCSKFKNGTFKMTYSGVGTVTIVRKGDFQTEEFPAKHVKAAFKVKWINTCKYTLTPTSETLKLYPKIPSTAIITVDIVKVNAHSYNQIATTNYSAEKIAGEMIKIK